jgi:hypothetical protein
MYVSKSAIPAGNPVSIRVDRRGTQTTFGLIPVEVTIGRRQISRAVGITVILVVAWPKLGRHWP